MYIGNAISDGALANNKTDSAETAPEDNKHNVAYIMANPMNPSNPELISKLPLSIKYLIPKKEITIEIKKYLLLNMTSNQKEKGLW